MYFRSTLAVNEADTEKKKLFFRYEPVLIQEMLILFIQIVKERRFCGLSTVENLRRELVYRLAIGDATHSQLVKSLPRGLSKNDQFRNMLDTIAVYSKPSGMKQVVVHMVLNALTYLAH